MSAVNKFCIAASIFAAAVVIYFIGYNDGGREARRASVKIIRHNTVAQSGGLIAVEAWELARQIEEGDHK